MELAATLVCIGAVLAVLAAGAWRTRPTKVELDPAITARLRDAILDPAQENALRDRVRGRVLQLGGVGLGHHAAAWGATAVGDVQWAKKEHPEGDFREGEPTRDMFLPESFTCVVIRELDEVKHKHVWFQNARRWLEPGGVLVVDVPKRASKGGVQWEVRDVAGHRTETVKYGSQTRKRSFWIYKESDAVVRSMIETAGFQETPEGFIAI
jgi:hypothetical protein